MDSERNVILQQPEAREHARQKLYRLALIQVLVAIVIGAYPLIFPADPIKSAVSTLIAGQLPPITNVYGWGGIVIVGAGSIVVGISLVKSWHYSRIAAAPTLDESLDRQQRYRQANNSDTDDQ